MARCRASGARRGGGSAGSGGRLDGTSALTRERRSESTGPRIGSAVDDAAPAVWADPVRQWVVRMTLQRLSDGAIPDRERRVLAWIAFHLAMSDDADTAFVPRRFLASDVRMTAAEAEAALESLVERGFLRVEYARSDERMIALRLLVQGMNDEPRGPWEH
jgi:DNA-binding MarR family transcriptional regulator